MGNFNRPAHGATIRQKTSVSVLYASNSGVSKCSIHHIACRSTDRTSTMLWVPHATTNSAWIGSKILQGAVGAPIESLCEISITDIYFAHERGSYMGLYAFMLAGSNFLAPILVSR